MQVWTWLCDMEASMDKFTSRNNEPEVEELPVFNGEEIPVFDPVEFEQSLNEDDDSGSPA